MTTEISYPITSRISMELLEEINKELRKTGKNMTQFLKEAILEKLNSNDEEAVDLEIKKREGEIDILKEKKKIILMRKKEMLNLPIDEWQFFIESKKIIERDPKFLEGRISSYKNEFGKDMSKKDFLEILKGVKDE